MTNSETEGRPVIVKIATILMDYQSPWFSSSQQTVLRHWYCLLLPFLMQGAHALFMLFVFISIFWYPTRFPCQMMLVSFNSNTTGVTSGAGIANSSGALSSSPIFSGILVVRSVVFGVVFRRLVFDILFLFLWPLCFRFFFNLNTPMTTLVSSNSSPYIHY